MKILENIRKLPLETRKIILWAIVIFLIIILIFFWAKNFQNKLNVFREQRKELIEKVDFSEREKSEVKIIDFFEETLKEAEEVISQEAEQERAEQEQENNDD